MGKGEGWMFWEYRTETKQKYKNTFKNIRNVSCLTRSMNSLFSMTDGNQQVTHSFVVANNTDKEKQQ